MYYLKIKGNDPQKKGLCIHLVEIGFITTHLIYSDIQKFKKKDYWSSIIVDPNGGI